jgi:hypothetical protein
MASQQYYNQGPPQGYGGGGYPQQPQPVRPFFFSPHLAAPLFCAIDPFEQLSHSRLYPTSIVEIPRRKEIWDIVQLERIDCDDK